MAETSSRAGIVHVKPLIFIAIGEPHLSAKQLHTSILQKSSPKASNGPQPLPPSAGLFGAFTLRFHGLCTAIRAGALIDCGDVEPHL